MSKQFKLAFIGGGINSAVGYTHRIASQMDNRWQVTTGCFSTHPDINKETAELWNTESYYDKWNDLLEKEKKNTDAIAILTPTNVHFDMVQAALQQGYPVICEKSLCATYEEAVAIAETVKNNNSFLAVINNYTGYPMLRELKEMIKNGMLGKIKHIQIEMPQEGFIRYVNNGEKPHPQDWRLHDGVIPTIYLDLGIHLHHIVFFLCDQRPVEVCASHDSYGFFDNIIDNVSCIAKYTDGVCCQMWLSKSALGNRNGLKVRVYGDHGSAEWFQMDSEVIKYCSKDGKIEIIDRASPGIIIANKARYNRFKSGHPAGFIEAFANYYYDIAEELVKYKQDGNFSEEWIISAEIAREGLGMLNAMVLSAKNKSWQKIY